jgi:hypothetical protein
MAPLRRPAVPRKPPESPFLEPGGTDGTDGTPPGALSYARENSRAFRAGHDCGTPAQNLARRLDADGLLARTERLQQRMVILALELVTGDETDPPPSEPGQTKDHEPGPETTPETTPVPPSRLTEPLTNGSTEPRDESRDDLRRLETTPGKNYVTRAGAREAIAVPPGGAVVPGTGESCDGPDCTGHAPGDEHGRPFCTTCENKLPPELLKRQRDAHAAGESSREVRPGAGSHGADRSRAAERQSALQGPGDARRPPNGAHGPLTGR